PGEAPDWWRAHDPPEMVAAVAGKADALGFAWLACSDHVAIPRRAVGFLGEVWYEPAATLGFLAAQTQRIRLMTNVLILPYHSPFDTAKQYATLDVLSKGRVILGVGVGYLRGEFRVLHAPFEERGAVTDEYLRILKTLWTQEEASFQGKYFDFHEVHVAPRPVQKPHPPILVGGNSRHAVRRAVELGDGWCPFDVTLDDVRARLAAVRDLPAFRARAAPFQVHFPGAAFQITPNPVDGADRPDFTGTPEQIFDDLRRYAGAGVTSMPAGFRARSLAEHLEKMEEFAEEIMAKAGGI